MRRNYRSGFTLPEVLVATVVLAMAITVLGQTVNNCLQAYRFTRHSDAHAWPMIKLRETILSLPSREAIEEGGELEINYSVDLGDDQREHDGKVRWEATIHPTNILNTYLLNIQATLQAGDTYSESRDFQLIAFRPNWADPEENESLSDAIRTRVRERLTARGEESLLEPLEESR